MINQPHSVRRLSDWASWPQHLARLLLLVSSSAACWLGILGLFGAQMQTLKGDPFLFMSPKVAVLTLVCGAVLGLSQWRLRWGSWAAVIVVGVLFSGLVAGHGIVVLDQRWLGIEIIAVSACMLGALCAWIVSKASASGSPWPDRYSILIAVAGCFLSVAGAYWLIDQQSRQIERQVQGRASEVARTLQESLLQSMWGFQRMAERWGSIDRAPSNTYVSMEFRTFLRDTQQAMLVAAINDVNQPVYAHFTSQANTVDLLALLNHELSKGLLQEVRLTNVAQLINVPMVARGKQVSLLATSWETIDGDGGLIVTAIDLPLLFERAFMLLQMSCCVTVTSDGVVVYRTGGSPPFSTFYSAQAPFNVGAQSFMVSFWLSEDAAEGLWNQFAWQFLLLGLVFTFFLNNSQRLAFIANRRAQLIQHRALHDPVTELPNRLMFERFVQQCRAANPGSESVLWVMFVALEGVRLINDSMGHGVGDRLLRTVGMRLRQALEPQSLVARIDSGNFAICLVDRHRDQIDVLAADLVKVISEPLIIDPHLLRINSVLGIVSSPIGSAEAETLLSQADLAMLRARRLGNNTWHYFTQELGEQASQQLALHADLQVALSSQQLVLHFQPVIDGESGQMVSFEALMRWHHPHLGLVPPSDFIPMAEETGQIVELTQWALEEAARAAKKINKNSPHPISVAVNVSIVFFRRNDFLQRVEDVLRRYDLPASLLEVEITESLMLDDSSSVLAKLRDLDALGVRIALDDFGTGYSGLNYLKRLPIHKVKLDRSFVSDILENPADAAIARAVVGVASLLRLTVTVEGVETETQFAFLKQIRCDQFQGYLFARPLALDGVMALLSHSKGVLSLPSPGSVNTCNQACFLVVGDASAAIQTLIFHLESLNGQIYRAKDVGEASAILATKHVHAVIATQDLATGDAMDLFARLKFMYPYVLRVLLATTAQKVACADALRDGTVDQMIRSPVQPYEVHGLVRDVLQAM